MITVINSPGFDSSSHCHFFDSLYSNLSQVFADDTTDMGTIIDSETFDSNSLVTVNIFNIDINVDFPCIDMDDPFYCCDEECFCVDNGYIEDPVTTA